MRFNFLEIKRKKDRNVLWLLVILSVCYSLGFLLIWCWINFCSLLVIGKSLFKSFNGTAVVIVTAIIFSIIAWVSAGWGAGHLLKVFKAYPPEEKDRYHRQFSNIIEEVKIASGIKDIHPMILPDSDINAFSCQDFSGEVIIGVTEGALAKLSRQELEAVVAHEMGHVMAGDLLSTTMFSVVMSVYTAFKEAGLILMKGADRSSDLRDSSSSSLGTFLVGSGIFVIAQLWSYLNYFLITAISRQREYRADALAVKIIRDPISLARALLRIKLSYKSKKIITDKLLSALFISDPFESAEDNEGFWSELFSTHPKLEDRLAVICNIASVSMGDLQRLVISEEKIKNKNRIKARIMFLEDIGASAGQIKRWFVLIQGQWLGPYDKDRLLKMDLSSDVFLKQEQDNTILMFSDFLGQIKDEVVKVDKDIFCPRCEDGMLLRADYEGVEVLACESCLGILVDREVLRRILGRREVGFSDEVCELAEKMLKTVDVSKRYSDYLKDFRPSFICPVCKNEKFTMIKMQISYKFPVEVDVCRMCSRIWFDPLELEILQCLVEKVVDKEGLGVDNVLSRYVAFLSL